MFRRRLIVVRRGVEMLVPALVWADSGAEADRLAFAQGRRFYRDQFHGLGPVAP